MDKYKKALEHLAEKTYGYEAESYIVLQELIDRVEIESQPNKRRDNMQNINGYFKYSKDELTEMKEEFGFSEARMSGFYSNLVTLKAKVEEIYDKHVFDLGHGLDDAPYHGWSKESLEGMWEMQEEIWKRFKEIYAIILCGIGYEEIEPKRLEE